MPLLVCVCDDLLTFGSQLAFVLEISAWLTCERPVGGACFYPDFSDEATEDRGNGGRGGVLDRPSVAEAILPRITRQSSDRTHIKRLSGFSKAPLSRQTCFMIACKIIVYYREYPCR